MEITFHGANCFKISSKLSTIVVDDNLVSLGLKSVAKDGDTKLYTQRNIEPNNTINEMIIDGPGEYELEDASVLGIQAKAYTDLDKEKTATIYKIVVGDQKLLILGHVQPKLDDKILESIGVIDVLLLPVGGGGFTLDAEDAASIIKILEPRITIPSHFADDSLNYQVPMKPVEDFFTKLGIKTPNALSQFKLKDEMEEAIVLLKS